MSAAPVVLCFLLRPSGSSGPEGDPALWDVLLGLKKRGFGQGKVVAIGGHVEAGETPEEALQREVWEEVDVVVPQESLAKLGVVRFVFPAQPRWDMNSVVYAADRWEGDVSPSEEISPEWHGLDSLPFRRMWPDAGHWLEEALTRAAQAVSGGSPEPFDVTVTLAEDNHAVAGVEWTLGGPRAEPHPAA
ncbi:8-oxo-dGTP diphosphatase [Arthrobacter woluwensis]|uniref:8-oxo-dGTP diphosphatase n=1 Tax=Arthrobacter woluwensis TaxID=156980 RepID=UPI0027834637|nr:NUDIX domain-containing protein [Arthrobacter woluwensis]MDQ0708364.1 8-oxo-dGTP diphosphatase [Arthrobacter woluwensis]